MSRDDYIANTRGARRYRFDEEVKRKKAVRVAKAEPRFLFMWLLMAACLLAFVAGALW